MEIGKDTYTATVVGVQLNEAYIDVRPPFTPSHGFMQECSMPVGTELDHFVTTPNVTRLEVRTKDEGMSRAGIERSFEDTARYIAAALNFVDQGKEPFELEPDELFEAQD
jgi:hypothetical protein